MIKTFELVLSALLLIAIAACTIWQIISKAPIVFIVMFVFMTISCGYILIQIIKEKK